GEETFPLPGPPTAIVDELAGWSADELKTRWLRFERLDGVWHADEPPDAPSKGRPRASQPAVKNALRPGPIADLAWGATAFVYGTLGDDLANEALQQFAAQLHQRWVDGTDAAAATPGDHARCDETPLLADHAVTPDDLNRRNLVLIGSPRTHLLLARWRGEFACRWVDPIDPEPFDEADQPGLDETSESAAAAFHFGGRRYDDPADALFLLQPTPGSTERYTLIVTANATAGLAAAADARLAYLPDYLVRRGPKVLHWGSLDPDWRHPDGE
ncbi:MAG: hypothetical protein ACRDD1_16245, partial [Planctomycetia bacterium]